MSVVAKDRNAACKKAVAVFKKEEPYLWESVRVWLADGWGLDLDRMPNWPTPEMIAAALLHEAADTDVAVAGGEASIDYAVRLRSWARYLIDSVHPTGGKS